MKKVLIKNGRLVNEGKTWEADIFVEDGRIKKIDQYLSQRDSDTEVIEAHGLLVLPGLIDDQVHFREPGLTNKADIRSESRAAVAGGITSYIEQPNTVPQTVTRDEWLAKNARAATDSLANYAFNFGATNDNLEEIKAISPQEVPGVKVFMGSSTGNMLVDDERALRGIFEHAPVPVITHCEDEATIQKNLADFKAKYGDDIPMVYHPDIRSREACLASSQLAVSLANEYGTKLHIYHISTAEECELFSNEQELEDKQITAEACIHHLWFNRDQYEEKGSFIKWNPAVKDEADRLAIWEAVKDGRIDVLATDHAPHTLAEKQNPYTSAPSGGPLVQHALPALMEFVRDEEISIELLVQKFCHNPARLFKIADRGYLREGYHADIVIIDPSRPWRVSRENLLYKCGWSPFEDFTFRARISHTLVNGQLVYDNGKIIEGQAAQQLRFNRES